MNIKDSEASRSTSSGGSLTSIKLNNGEISKNEEAKRSKHANYRDMVNYEALEVRQALLFVYEQAREYCCKLNSHSLLHFSSSLQPLHS